MSHLIFLLLLVFLVPSRTQCAYESTCDNCVALSSNCKWCAQGCYQYPLACTNGQGEDVGTRDCGVNAAFFGLGLTLGIVIIVSPCIIIICLIACCCYCCCRSKESTTIIQQQQPQQQQPQSTHTVMVVHPGNPQGYPQGSGYPLQSYPSVQQEGGPGPIIYQGFPVGVGSGSGSMSGSGRQLSGSGRQLSGSGRRSPSPVPQQQGSIVYQQGSHVRSSSKDYTAELHTGTEGM